MKTVLREKKNNRFDIRDTCTKHIEDKKKLHFWVYMPFKFSVDWEPLPVPPINVVQKRSKSCR